MWLEKFTCEGSHFIEVYLMARPSFLSNHARSSGFLHAQLKGVTCCSKFFLTCYLAFSSEKVSHEPQEDLEREQHLSGSCPSGIRMVAVARVVLAIRPAGAIGGGCVAL